jgi:Bacterial SH3 domain
VKRGVKNMDLIRAWGKPITILAVLSIAAGGINIPANAGNSNSPSNTTSSPKQSPVPNPSEKPTPQPSVIPFANTLIGQCRAAKRSIFIYSQPNTTSKSVRTLAAGEEVILADNGSAGFIAISSPTPGFVEAKDLTSCGGKISTPTPTPSGNGCRKVADKDKVGLVVRSQPNRTGSVVGGVGYGTTVTLKTDPPQYSKDSNGRSWVEITAPLSGWVSNGFPEAKTTNLVSCE